MNNMLVNSEYDTNNSEAELELILLIKSKLDGGINRHLIVEHFKIPFFILHSIPTQKNSFSLRFPFEKKEWENFRSKVIKLYVDQTISVCEISRITTYPVYAIYAVIFIYNHPNIKIKSLDCDKINNVFDRSKNPMLRNTHIKRTISSMAMKHRIRVLDLDFAVADKIHCLSDGNEKIQFSIRDLSKELGTTIGKVQSTLRKLERICVLKVTKSCDSYRNEYQMIVL